MKEPRVKCKRNALQNECAKSMWSALLANRGCRQQINPFLEDG